MKDNQNIELSKFSLREIMVSDCAIPEWQQKRNLESVYTDSLITSIKHHGVLQPILVSKYESKKYEYTYKWQLITGLKRLYVCHILNIESIPALIINDVISETNAKQFTYLEAQKSMKVTPDEIWDAIKLPYVQFGTGDLQKDSRHISDLTGIPYAVIKETLISKTLEVKNKNSSPIKNI